MKKFLLSIAAAFLAVTMNAETNIPLNFGSWGSATFDAETQVVTCPTSNWDGWQFDVPAELQDASEYDFLVMQVESCDFGFQVYVKMANWTQTYTSETYAAGTTLVGIDLSDKDIADYINAINQVQIQSHNSGTMKVKSLSYMSSEEYEAAKTADANKEKKVVKYDNKEFSLVGEPTWNGVWWGDSGLGALYKTAVVQITSSTGPVRITVQGAANGDGSENNYDFYVDKVTDTPATIAIPITSLNGSVNQIAIMNDYITNAEFDGIDETTGEAKAKYTYGDNNVVVSVYYTSLEVESNYTTAPEHPTVAIPEAIKSVDAQSAAAPMYNLSGVRVNAAKGVTIQNGKKYLAK